MVEHKFGGHWTETKLNALRDYLHAYATALKAQPFRLHYIDAFAGTGAFVPGDGKQRQGSAQIALSVSGFHEYHFIEKKPRRCDSLRRMAAAMPTKNIEVIEGDANGHIAELCRRTGWRGARAVLFLDPYGMHVEWPTLQAIADTGAIDVWYLFPLSGVTRQLALNESNLDDDKRRSLDRVLGTSEWRDAFYAPSPTMDLFGAAQIERHADTVAIENWVTARLRTVFPVVEGPAILKLGSKGRMDSGPRIFGLYFLASTKSARAQTVAKRIANGVLEKLRREAASATATASTISPRCGSLWEDAE